MKQRSLGRCGIMIGEVGLGCEGLLGKSVAMDEIKAGFEDQLARLGTDYLDIGTIHYVDAMDDWQMVLDAGILDYARKLKKQGIIRAIGLSSHNPKVALKAVESGDIDVLLFP